MNEKLLKKLMAEEPLDPAEHLELEQALESGDRNIMSAYLSSQDHVEPSLAWRSQLNDQLRQIAPAQPKRPWLTWAGLVGVGAAAFVAALIFAQPGKPVSTSVVAESTQPEVVSDGMTNGMTADNDLGSVLITTHQADVTQASIGIKTPRYSRRSRLDISEW
jgi:hypothetical protein